MVPRYRFVVTEAAVAVLGVFFLLLATSMVGGTQHLVPPPQLPLQVLSIVLLKIMGWGGGGTFVCLLHLFPIQQATGH